nr:DUF3347 domain-containing protein [Bacteroidota bacterium]
LLAQPLKKSVDNIVKSKSLKDQRRQFETLSDRMIDAVQNFGVQKDNVYKAYCPMAKNDKGAFWLSEFEEIRNPYFGEAMLMCGEVREIINTGIKLDNKEIKNHQH